VNKVQFIACNKPLDNSDVVLFGAPFDGTTSFKPGTRFAPNIIRLDSEGIETYSPYQDDDLLDTKVCDIGDVSIYNGNTEKTLKSIYMQSIDILLSDKTPFMIGGEHLVTLPSVQAVYEKFPELRVIHFDAHTDLREHYNGEKNSHATVMKRVSDLLGKNRIYQFGIRSGLKEEFEFAKNNHYIETFKVDTITKILDELDNHPIYLTVDLDVLDPSILWGTGTPEPGGVTFNELLNALLTLKGKNIVGADIVELAPNYDTSGVSTAVACKLIREILLIIKKPSY
jgi:agmatinase